jgi:hypothetical protein
LIPVARFWVYGDQLHMSLHIAIFQMSGRFFLPPNWVALFQPALHPTGEEVWWTHELLWPYRWIWLWYVFCILLTFCNMGSRTYLQ